MEEQGGLNLYGTCRNNLTNFIDPYGLDTFEDVSNFVAGAGDALSFGLTRQGRKAISWMFFDGFNDSAVNTESRAYFAGEVTESVVEITVTLGGASLRHVAKHTVRAVVEGGARASFRRANKLVGGFVHHINPIKGARYPLPFRWAARGSWNMKWVPTRAAHAAEDANLLRMEALDRARESTLLIRQAANEMALYVEGKYKCGDWSIDIKAGVQGYSIQDGPEEFGLGVEASVVIEESGGGKIAATTSGHCAMPG